MGVFSHTILGDQGWGNAYMLSMHQGFALILSDDMPEAPATGGNLLDQYCSSCGGTGDGEIDADACSSGQHESGHQVVFMWQVGQSENHYREAVSGAHVHRSDALHLVLLT